MTQALSTDSAPVISPRNKGLAPHAWGMSYEEFLQSAPRLRDQQTPLLTLDKVALEHNVTQMFAWAESAGLSMAPHGKTTMAPRLWAQLMDAGAWGITVATGWQAQVARSAGISRVMIANSLVDPAAIGWVAAEMAADPEAEFISWVDDSRAVDNMEAVLRAAGARRKMPVLVELGANHARTGVRGVRRAIDLARRVHDSRELELAGVAGYAGALAHDRSAASLARVDAYLDDIATLYRSVSQCDLLRDASPIVTAGGSAYFDRVAARLGNLSDAAIVLLRSGAFQIHDDGYYAGISPMGDLPGTESFRSAMHMRTRVLSRPEPHLALLDAGKRDLPFDEGLPVPLFVVGVGREKSRRLLEGARVTALNDQHTFLEVHGAGARDLPPGTVLVLGLSHPCTAMDRWRLVPVVEYPADPSRPASSHDDAVITGLIETVF
jgi:D-serine deaminase-like pyridoxal phosphate-dependent protein